MSKEAMKLALEAAYIAGWNASGEGYNAEYPFGDHAKNPEEDAVWVKNRDNALRKALAEQPAQPQQEPVAWIPITEWRWNNNAGTWEGLTITSPQAQRTWVGLTQEEIDLVWDSVPETQFWWRHYGQAIEAKLKEKNT